MRVHPTLNEYQKKIVTAMAFNDGIDPASIVKVSIGDKIKKLTDSEREYYLKLYDKMNDDQRKNPTK